MINTTHSGLYFLPDDVRAKLDHCRANDPPERKQRRIEKEIQASGIPEGFQKASFDRLKPDVNQAAHDLCRAFADTGTCGTKNGLLLMGPTGCGKTTLAAAILRKTVERMGGTHSVQFANIPQLLEEVRQSYNPDQRSAFPMEGIANNYMVVLDDFGIGKRNPWVEEQFYRLIDRLYTQGRSVIVTTNISTPQLDKFDDRLVSRLLGTCEEVHMKGRDYRVDPVQTNK